MSWPASPSRRSRSPGSFFCADISRWGWPASAAARWSSPASGCARPERERRRDHPSAGAAAHHGGAERGAGRRAARIHAPEGDRPGDRRQSRRASDDARKCRLCRHREGLRRAETAHAHRDDAHRAQGLRTPRWLLARHHRRERDMTLSTLGAAHYAAALAALALGLVVLVERKGTASHRVIGCGYVAAMILLNVTALGVYRLTGRFGPFHALALVSLATVIAGVAIVWRRRANWLRRHYYFMAWSYVGLLAAACAEAVTRAPLLRAAITTA